MKLRTLLCLPALLTLLQPALVGAPSAGQAGEEVQPDELGSTVNVHRSGELWFAGQFTPEDVAVLKERGIRRVITLRTKGEVEWDEAGLVEEAGMEFVALPFRAPETLTDELFGELRELLADGSGPTLLHCGSANRVGGAWLPYRVLDQGVPLERALEEAKTIGLRTPAYGEHAVAYVERELARDGQREKSVKQGINDTFKDPDLDVEQFVQRFEVETREVYVARHAVVEAMGLVPGMHVADVGAGTGLYTLLLAEAVGDAGWVYAVDIAPRFLERIRGLAAESKVANLTEVLCAEDSINLPPASIDLAWVCDTYHHFEYPQSSLASTYAALRPGGRLLVLDFERIPGESREWLLSHVRAGKEVFRAEIEASGFEFVRELDVEGLEENYLLEFRKPKR